MTPEPHITATLGGNPPDVLSLDAVFVSEMAGRNLLHSWNDYISDLDEEDFNKGMWTAATLNGQLYALRYRGSSGVYMYNKVMFDEAGVPYPEEGWNYDDMLEIAKKITVPGEKYGVGIAAAGPRAVKLPEARRALRELRQAIQAGELLHPLSLSELNAVVL